ncbi:MAG: hypothetical protein JG774_280 [Desulfomicrobiaceae bacterium]|jgi:hypothetical protein|nr:hypothetical protein [Desulfomicrobiaceae bacterium]
METLEQFLESWEDCAAKEAFGILREALAAVPGVVLSTKLRPGVSISLRGGHPRQEGRELFVMVDIIDDDPENRWLSVCFYDDLVSDPEERGDFVPQGLLGEDARCFDLDEADADAVGYVAQRIREAGARAGRS